MKQQLIQQPRTRSKRITVQNVSSAVHHQYPRTHSKECETTSAVTFEKSKKGEATLGTSVVTFEELPLFASSLLV